MSDEKIKCDYCGAEETEEFAVYCVVEKLVCENCYERYIREEFNPGSIQWAINFFCYDFDKFEGYNEHYEPEPFRVKWCEKCRNRWEMCLGYWENPVRDYNIYKGGPSRGLERELCPECKNENSK